MNKQAPGWFDYTQMEGVGQRDTKISHISYFYEHPAPLMGDGYYFWDETLTQACGPFETTDLAQAALDKYAEHLNRPHCSSTQLQNDIVEFHQATLANLTQSMKDMAKDDFAVNLQLDAWYNHSADLHEELARAYRYDAAQLKLPVDKSQS